MCIRLIVAVLIPFHCAHAAFEVYSRWENGTQVVHFLGDKHHDGTNEQRIMQQSDLIDFGKNLGAQSLMVVEDLPGAKQKYLLDSFPLDSDRDATGNIMRQMIFAEERSLEKSCASPLPFLMKKCAELDIPCENIEFRIDNKESTNALVEADIMSFFESSHPNILARLVEQGTVKHPEAKFASHVKANALIEAKVLKEIVRHPDRSNVVVALGTGHLLSLETILPLFGFTNTQRQATGPINVAKVLLSK